MFASFEKFDGREMRHLTPAEVKQIAGRAGRYGSKYPEGIVTCLNPVSRLHDPKQSTAIKCSSCILVDT